MDDATPELAAAAARHWQRPAPRLLRVGMSALYECGDVVLRVRRVGVPTAGRSMELAELLTARGIRVPLPARDDVVADGEFAATAWHRLVPTDDEPDWREAGRMVAEVHAIDPRSLPRGQPLPPCESFPWWHFDERLAEVDGALDAAARAGLAEVIDRHAGWTEGLERVVCHGDVHPGNVMMTAEGVTLLDWDMLCAGPPAWDHAMLMRLDRWGWPPRWYDEFAAGYGHSLAGESTAEALADLRLVAATLMRLRAALSDPSAMPEAQLRLAYWRGEPDAPVWTAV